ncbi:cell wall hydrolase [Sphingomonas solaris]|uniref:Cell wall hydrolase n=1 Tax=Alterirhizorhabdus solaris TaxID=2529389 RepID=A0A558R1P1_9SPHN|nr:cell wall hydrolase [Sphingomonas solaris]TVV73279.1 cell wall hydrolase [Sphingomonas solaris]
MLHPGHIRLLAAGALTLATVIPATFVASEASLAATFSVEPTPAPSAALSDSDDLIAIDVLTADDSLLSSENAALIGDTRFADAADSDDAIDDQLECMAKVVLHEAGNQPRDGQLAVAQLIVNRVESGRFADTVCGVVNQPGQFFRTASYNPRRDSAAWASAVSVSREATAGRSADVVEGAMFFRAAYSAPDSFFRTRTRVATLGDHVFYR